MHGLIIFLFEYKIKGIGKLEWPDGKTYEGEFVFDKREGDGNFYWSNGK